jgi:hypothetical protein
VCASRSRRRWCSGGGAGVHVLRSRSPNTAHNAATTASVTATAACSGSAAARAADVVAAWHGHTERMTQAVYGRVTDSRLTAAADVFSSAVGQI